MAAKLYGSFFAKTLNKEINYSADAIKVMLLTSAYTANQNVHAYVSDVVANEVTGTGYTAGGATLATKTVTYDGVTRVTILDADDVTWPTSTITARYAVVYDSTPATNATRPLIGYVDFTSDQSSTAGNFTITWDATGIARLTVA